MCGATGGRPGTVAHGKDLSPHVRGNRRLCLGLCRPAGSIPACAGQSSSRYRRRSLYRVYPRMCGAIAGATRHAVAQWGLSPHVRGNPQQRGRVVLRQGSIPACAGQSGASPRFCSRPGVYPRMCGAIGGAGSGVRASEGLSPHVRGNLHQDGENLLLLGSIPACAGQSTSPAKPTCAPRVYPRMCGAIIDGRRIVVPDMGLSPHVRGNPLTKAEMDAIRWSIPACAGQSHPAGVSSDPPGVYPRMCGAIFCPHDKRKRGQGLSPHVRGNQGHGQSRARRAGSIPACAGQSRARCPCPDACWVYPRMCGAIARALAKTIGGTGLSPHVRGNHQANLRQRLVLGSIPACAGQSLPRKALTSFTLSKTPPFAPDGASGMDASLAPRTRTQRLANHRDHAPAPPYTPAFRPPRANEISEKPPKGEKSAGRAAILRRQPPQQAAILAAAWQQPRRRSGPAAQPAP
ncbi:hypothetical protein [Azospirillum endophyticum]